MTPEAETDIKIIVKNTDKNEKLAWVRKNKKMESLIDKLKPYEYQMHAMAASKEPIILKISELRKQIEELTQHLGPIDASIQQIDKQRYPLLDEIEELRKVMVKECIHPEDSLVHRGTYIDCKFCNRKITVNRNVAG
jgi:hypothetical protein